MAYAIRYERHAREDLDVACETYGQEFRAAIQDWFTEIAEAAEKREPMGQDVQQAADVFGKEVLSSAKHSVRRWRAASAYEKFRALLLLLTKRRPPWELWKWKRGHSSFPALPSAHSPRKEECPLILSVSPYSLREKKNVPFPLFSPPYSLSPPLFSPDSLQSRLALKTKYRIAPVR
jgi:hypothetical protein